MINFNFAIYVNHSILVCCDFIYIKNNYKITKYCKHKKRRLPPSLKNCHLSNLHSTINQFPFDGISSELINI